MFFVVDCSPGVQGGKRSSPSAGHPCPLSHTSGAAGRRTQNGETRCRGG